MAKAKQERINVNPFAHLPIWLNSVNILWCVHCIALPVWGGGGTNPPAHPSPVNPFPSNPLTVQLLIFEQQQQLLWKSQIAHFVQLHFVVCENYKLLVKKALNKCAKILEKCTQRKLKALPLPLCLLILLHTSLWLWRACCVWFLALWAISTESDLSLLRSRSHTYAPSLSLYTQERIECVSVCARLNALQQIEFPAELTHLKLTT